MKKFRLILLIAILVLVVGCRHDRQKTGVVVSKQHTPAATEMTLLPIIVGNMIMALPQHQTTKEKWTVIVQGEVVADGVRILVQESVEVTGAQYESINVGDRVTLKRM